MQKSLSKIPLCEIIFLNLDRKKNLFELEKLLFLVQIYRTQFYTDSESQILVLSNEVYYISVAQVALEIIAIKFEQLKKAHFTKEIVK